jgi:hypothetical protein
LLITSSTHRPSDPNHLLNNQSSNLNNHRTQSSILAAATGSGGGRDSKPPNEDDVGYVPLSGETVSKEDLIRDLARNTKGRTPHMKKLRKKLEDGRSLVDDDESESREAESYTLNSREGAEKFRLK